MTLVNRGKTMKNLLVYPVSKDTISILRHRNMIKDFSEIRGVVTSADFIPGKDISYIDNANAIHIDAEDDFTKELKLADTVLFSVTEGMLDFEQFYMPKIEECVKNNKDIGFLFDLEEEQKIAMKDFCRLHHVHLFPWREDAGAAEEQIKLSQFHTPIVFVTGAGSTTDKFELQLALREAFHRDGFKVAQIGSKYYSELFGFHAIPQFMYKGNLTESEKIYGFNQYVKQIEAQENPDIIVIGIPLGVLKSRYDHEDFNQCAYEISSAVVPDYTFMNVYFEKYDAEYMEEIIKEIYYKYKFEVNQIIVTNNFVDEERAQQTSEQEIVKIPYEEVDRLVYEMKKEADFIPIFSLYTDMAECYDCMKQELNSNADTIVY